jgi:hypothetical protein
MLMPYLLSTRGPQIDNAEQIFEVAYPWFLPPNQALDMVSLLITKQCEFNLCMRIATETTAGIPSLLVITITCEIYNFGVRAPEPKGAAMLAEGLAGCNQAAPAFRKQPHKLCLGEAWSVPGVQLEQQFQRCQQTTRHCILHTYASRRLSALCKEQLSRQHTGLKVIPPWVPSNGHTWLRVDTL